MRRFDGLFAPQAGLVSDAERPFREELCLNGLWSFSPVQAAEAMGGEESPEPVFPRAENWETVPLKVPSPWNVNGFAEGGGGDFRSYPSYPESWAAAKAGWLRKSFTVPPDWQGCRIILHFEAVAGETIVFVNRREVGRHSDPFLPFRFDITELVLPGGEAEVLLRVAHGSLHDDPGSYGRRQYVAGSFWGRFIAGIWQDVHLLRVPTLHVTDLAVRPWVDRDRLEVEVTVRNSGEGRESFSLEGAVRRWTGGRESETPGTGQAESTSPMDLLAPRGGPFELEPGAEKAFILEAEVRGTLATWSPEEPALHDLLVSIVRDGGGRNGAIADRARTRFGWRQFSIRGRRLLLNGKPFRMKGDSWHFMGIPQMTPRYAAAWYRMLKAANANSVRLHAQPYPRFYLDLADEMGICVIDETGIWGSDGGPKFDSARYWEACGAQVRDLVLRDRNHPSVVGFSVCNELVEVARQVLHAPKSLRDTVAARIRDWVGTVRRLDPSRDWISGDGEIFGRTGLPTFVEHYAWKGLYPLIALLRKPWGTGETGMAYFGTPRQVARHNGHRAYHSQQGRMEGLAAEAFDLLSAQRRHGSSYASVFNLVWYGLKPLPLGLDDPSRPPRLEDGIWFGEHREGLPGCQPERLGPYCSTLNPGYDEGLPAYDPWPLFEAAREAFADDYRTRRNRWKARLDDTVRTGRSAAKQGCVWLSGGTGSQAGSLLESVLPRQERLVPGKRQLVVIDGSCPPCLDGATRAALREAMEGGSTVLVWQAGEAAGSVVEALSGLPIDFHRRDASSYLVARAHPIIRGESSASLYFCETVDEPLSRLSLAGAWMEKASVILEACGTDWRRWNRQEETIKTARTRRSELEAKGPGAVIARQAISSGELLVSTLDLSVLGPMAGPRLSAMLRNLGASIPKRQAKPRPALDRRSRLKRAMEASPTGAGTMRTRSWWPGGITLRGPGERSLGFWLWSPRPLDDLLAEPGVPALDMRIRTGAAIEVELNGRALGKVGSERDDRGGVSVYKGLPLAKGWNRIVLRIRTSSSKASLTLRLRSSSRRYLRALESLPARGTSAE